MEKMHDILYSLVPLILIVLLSWLFSFLGSRKKKEAAGQEETGAVSPTDQFVDFFTQVQQEDEDLGERLAREPEQQVESWETMHPAFRGPKVNAKPIKPKWWGA